LDEQQKDLKIEFEHSWVEITIISEDFSVAIF